MLDQGDDPRGHEPRRPHRLSRSGDLRDLDHASCVRDLYLAAGAGGDDVERPDAVADVDQDLDAVTFHRNKAATYDFVVELGRVRAGLVRSAIALFVLLAATGVWLSFFYRPTMHGWAQTMHSMHIAYAIVLVFVLVALLAVTVAERGGWHLAATLFLASLALAYTGLLLPWDQLALWAVTIGTNIRGFFTLFGDEVRYVLINGVEVSTGTLRAWFVVHALVLPLVFGAVLWRLRRHRHVESEDLEGARV